MTLRQPPITVVIPTYNAAAFIKPTLDSLTAQTFTDFTVLVVDDGSRDDTCGIIERHGFPSLRLVRNPSNLGCVQTLARCVELATDEILVFLCHDDILSPNALERIVGAFHDPAVGAVTRPLFWFEGDQINRPNRVVRPIDSRRDTLIRATDDARHLRGLIETLGQASGLGFRRKFMTVPFSDDVFTVHIQAFLGILREHPVVLLSDYIVAVRTETSQSRTVSAVYETSPLESWDRMLRRVFPEPRFAHTLHACRRVICTKNDVGLVQVKCSGGQRKLLREIAVSLRVWPGNLIRPHFWLWCLITLILPRGFLRRTIDRLKNLLGPRLATGIRLAGSAD